MNLTKAFDEIEGSETSARVNAASDLRIALMIASELPAVKWLQEKLEKADCSEAVIKRVQELCSQTVDPRYEHPHDTGLLVYAWLLAWHAPKLLPLALSSIGRTPGLWWASKLARQFLERKWISSKDTSVSHSPATPTTTVTTESIHKILLGGSLTGPPLVVANFELLNRVGPVLSSTTLTTPSEGAKHSYHNDGAKSQLVAA